MKEKYSIKQIKKEKVSLVLSGGSAYGLAHLGVLEFLEENRIKPDEILGTSMGSIIAAFYALGRNSVEIKKILKTFRPQRLVKTQSGKFYKNMEILLKDNFGDRRMKDVSIPLKIMTTELDGGRGKLFTNKDNFLIYEVVLASIAIPGLFEPRKIGKKKYIDGGIYSNLAIECAKRRNIKIASNVVNSHQRYVEKVKKHFLFPNLRRKIDLMKYTIHYLLENQTYTKLPLLKKVILIEPNMKEFSQFSFRDYRKIITRGYFAAKEMFSK